MKQKDIHQHNMSYTAIFIDANVYITNGFTLPSKVEELLTTLTQKEDSSFKFFTSSIIASEVQKHAFEFIQKENDTIKSSIHRIKRKENSNAYNSLNDFITALSILDLPNEEKLKNHCEQNIETYFTKLKAIYLDIDSVSISELFESYFKKSPPFSSGKKKHEFPDAANILALSKLTHEKILIYSEDKDFKDFVEKNSSQFGLVTGTIDCIDVLENILHPTSNKKSSATLIDTHEKTETIILSASIRDEITTLIENLSLEKLWDYIPAITEPYDYNGYAEIDSWEYTISDTLHLPDLKIDINTNSQSPLKLQPIIVSVPYNLYCEFSINAYDAADGGYFSFGSGIDKDFEGELTVEASIYLNINNLDDIYCEDVVLEVRENQKPSIDINTSDFIY